MKKIAMIVGLVTILATICWYYVGTCAGRFVYFFVGTDSMRGYDSNTMKEVC